MEASLDFDSYNYDKVSPLTIFNDYMNLVKQDEELNELNSSTNHELLSNVTPSLEDEVAVDPSFLSSSKRKIQLFQDVLREGSSTIERLMTTSKDASLASQEVRELQLLRVKLKNFGPYGGPDEVVYPLSNRGRGA
jgi:hypothetical protein